MWTCVCITIPSWVYNNLLFFRLYKIQFEQTFAYRCCFFIIHFSRLSSAIRFLLLSSFLCLSTPCAHRSEFWIRKTKYIAFVPVVRIHTRTHITPYLVMMLKWFVFIKIKFKIIVRRQSFNVFFSRSLSLFYFFFTVLLLVFFLHRRTVKPFWFHLNKI